MLKKINEIIRINDKILLGRSKDCDIILKDQRVSLKHCEITKNGDAYSIQDLSNNGTFINERKIGKTKTR